MEDKLSGLLALAALLIGFVAMPVFYMKVWGKDKTDDANDVAAPATDEKQ